MKLKMNVFVIALGSYVIPLSEEAIAVANKIGTIKADMGDTACKIPNAVNYIMKVKNKGLIGKKKKMARC